MAVLNDTSLSEEFAQSAARFGNDLPENLLLTKFQILMRHTAKDDVAEKNAIVATLLDSTIRPLEKIINSDRPGYIADSFENDVTTLLKALTAPECQQHLPADTADRLGNAALGLVRKAEKTTADDFKDSNGKPHYSDYTDYRKNLTALAMSILGMADKMTEILDRTANVTTGSTITASKPLTLKPASNGG